MVFSRLQTDDLDSPPPKTQNFLARSTPLSLWAVAESIVDAQSLIEVYPELVKSNKVVPALGPVVVNIDIKQPFQVIYRYLVHTVFPQVVARSRNGAARVLPRDIQLDLQIQYKNSKGETIKSEPAKITGNHFQATLLASLQAIDSLKIPIITAGISLQGQEEDQAIVDWLNEEAPTRYQWGQLEKMVLAELPRVAPRDAQAAITRSNEILDRLRELLQGQCSREQFEEALRNAGDAPHLVSCQEISPFLEQLSPGIIVLSAKASELIHSSPQDIIRFAHRLGTLGRGPNLKLAEDPADPQFRVPLSELLTRLREDRDSED
ncbi:MAG: hypothetical protein LBI20_02855 [Holosporales bacterium]|nr:hypothetical protein [Holosporales bacterium]